MSKTSYEMRISLSVLQDLGIKLYSNVPAVLSEVVANAWDADAEEVTIDISADEITILDDGHGMSVEDANNKYLNVGYKRREEGNVVTTIYKRPVMGRKGIGKLSLFSIAHIVEVQSSKGGNKHGFSMNVVDIEDEIKKKGGHSNYKPTPLRAEELTIEGDGTLITLRELKKNITKTPEYLRKRIARRFSILGAEHNFNVYIDGVPVQIGDRDYFHKLQNLWYFGEESKEYLNCCDKEKLKHSEKRPNIITVDSKEYKVKGWIGTVKSSGDLKEGSDNLNKIVVMMRGKLAQEDTLEDFAEGGLYTKYLIGEIQAEFLDLDGEEDIATTSRQEIIKDSPRYKALRDWIFEELKYIEKKWTDLRNADGTKQALEIPAILSWYKTLNKDTKNKAEKLFGKINTLTIDSEEQRKELLKHGVLAFESLRYKNALDTLEKVTPDNIELLTEVFNDLEDIEATLYHQIVKERLLVIKALTEKVEENALEKILQIHIFDNLWLLDPSWERATTTEYMEKRIESEFKEIRTKGLTEDERAGRVDIKYRKTSGTHVLIELKRADRVVTTGELIDQVTKYRSTLKKILIETGNEDDPIDIICVVGKELKDWKDTADGKAVSVDALKPFRARVVMYQELIENAEKSYQSFLDSNKKVGRVAKLLEDIETDFIK